MGVKNACGRITAVFGVLLIQSVLIGRVWGEGGGGDCVPRCNCQLGDSELLVDCSNRSYSTIIDAARAGVGKELFMTPLVPPATTTLNLSGNHITQLTTNALAGLRHPEQLIEL